jgi:D-alanyl-D-alanine carboxypeptidase
MIWGKNEHNRKEIASLTKVMTCYLAIQLLEKLRIDPFETFVEVSAYASQVGGTSANFREGDTLTVNDVLYGLMLPSGNDAASVLAENLGVYLYFQSKEFLIKHGN